MNTTTLRLTTAHPPCPPDSGPEDRVLEIPVPADRSRLPLSSRLSLRIGLWLLLRAQRPRRRQAPPFASDADATFFPFGRHLTQREAMILLTYDLQRQLR